MIQKIIKASLITENIQHEKAVIQQGPGGSCTICGHFGSDYRHFYFSVFLTMITFIFLYLQELVYTFCFSVMVVELHINFRFPVPDHLSRDTQLPFYFRIAVQTHAYLDAN